MIFPARYLLCSIVNDNVPFNAKTPLDGLVTNRSVCIVLRYSTKLGRHFPFDIVSRDRTLTLPIFSLHLLRSRTLPFKK